MSFAILSSSSLDAFSCSILSYSYSELDLEYLIDLDLARSSRSG